MSNTGHWDFSFCLLTSPSEHWSFKSFVSAHSPQEISSFLFLIPWIHKGNHYSGKNWEFCVMLVRIKTSDQISRAFEILGRKILARFWLNTIFLNTPIESTFSCDFWWNLGQRGIFLSIVSEYTSFMCCMFHAIMLLTLPNEIILSLLCSVAKIRLYFSSIPGSC